MIVRISNGFQSLHQAIGLAPEVWTAMFIRMAVKPEVHKFVLDIVSALVIHLSHKVPETSWVCISRLVHKLTKHHCSVDF